MAHRLDWIERALRRWHAWPPQRRSNVLAGSLALVLGVVTLLAFHAVVSDEVERAAVERPLAAGGTPTGVDATDSPRAPPVGAPGHIR